MTALLVAPEIAQEIVRVVNQRVMHTVIIGVFQIVVNTLAIITYHMDLVVIFVVENATLDAKIAVFMAV